MVTKKQIQEILKEYPNLNYFGFGLFEERVRRRKGELNQEQYDSELKELQQQLFDNVGEIDHVVNLLQGIEKIKTFNERHSSYGLKHWAEKTAPNHYVSNGSFIVGAIVAGFKLKINQPNAYFNISEKSLKQVTKEHGQTI